MNKYPARKTEQERFSHQLSRTNIWVWITILVSVLICASVTWLHFQQQQVLELATNQLSALRLARIDLNKGFVNLSLSGPAVSPYDREQGMALLQQAIDSIRENFQGPDQESQSIEADFNLSVEEFLTAVKEWNESSSINPSRAANLRITFSNLDHQADLIDQKARQNLAALTVQSDQQFALVLGIDLLLLLGVCAIVITASRTLERNTLSLQESEAKFRALFQNNHAPMLLIDPEDGKINDANPAASSFYGWNHDEITRKKIFNINTMSTMQINDAIKKVITREAQNFEFKHRLASGEIRDVEIYSGPIEQKGRTLIYSIIHDISSRKQAEKALEESETRYRELLLLAPIGIVVMAEGRVRFINPTGADILGGKSTDDISGKFITDFLPLEKNGFSPNHSKPITYDHERSYPIEETFSRLDGTKVIVDMMTAPLVYRGKPAVQIIFSDISERKSTEEKIMQTQSELQRLLKEADNSRNKLLKLVKKQEQTQGELNKLNAELEVRVQHRTAQLEAANQELEAFSYSVSHDLRAPLRGINGWGMALVDDYHDKLDETAQQYLENIRSETERMGNLIDDLLRLARITRADYKSEPVDLSNLAEMAVGRLNNEYPGKRVKISIERDLKVIGDQNLLEIAIFNLLANAYKFTNRQPEADISFGRKLINDETTYFVQDNGVGFDSSAARNLFGAFQRMHRQSEFPGNGIGLATVKRIILRHGGRIWAESRKNEGTTFYFTLNSK